jgi:hypothetical protein
MQLVAFGSKWYSDVVSEDKMPRKLKEIFPSPARSKRAYQGVLPEDISSAQHMLLQLSLLFAFGYF